MSRKEELIPVVYFHVVFTLPQELNPFVLGNMREAYIALFAAAVADARQGRTDVWGRMTGFQIRREEVGESRVYAPLHYSFTGKMRSVGPTQRWS